MSSAVELEVLYKIGNAPLRGYPFPHLYVTDIFPQAYYAELQRNLPGPESMKSLEEISGARGYYPERAVMAVNGERPAGMPEEQFAFWSGLWRWMLSGPLGHLMLQRFGAAVERRFQQAPDAEVRDEALLVYDRAHYALGPHTDAPRKLVTMLFYLPADDHLARHGTSIYVPKEPGFTCPGGPHYMYEIFDRVTTLPFVPNALFAFAKTDNSFHGVERFEEPNAGRWLLLLDLYLHTAPAEAPVPADPASPVVQFKF